MNNKIIPTYDNKVTFVFSFDGEFGTDGLNNFQEIILTIGNEEYSTLNTPTKLYTESPTELVLQIGDSTSLEAGYYIPEIVAINNDYLDGYLLTGACRNMLETPIVVCC